VNAKLWVCVLAGVLIAHLALLFIIDHLRTMGQPLPRVIEPTFTTSTITYVDTEGRKVQVVREYTVSTELADEATLAKLPPAPKQP
jgi:hypothetical protein